jgi:hypothetical protein
MDPRLLYAGGAVLYGLVAAIALAWLWLRGRLGAVPEYAIGAHGPWLGAGVGLASGWVGALLLGVASRRAKVLAGYDAAAHAVFRRVGDVPVAVVIVVAAVAEELLFRLAALDALGFAGSVAFAAIANTTVAGLRMLPITLLHALALSLLVAGGFGLLGSTTASAVGAYLNLRRIQCSP